MRTVAAALFTVAALFVAGSPCPGGEPDLPYYVGRSVCAECHANDGEASPCAVEPIPAHDRSYGVLDDPRALEIALLSGVTVPPKQSRICLGCHATSSAEGPRWTEETFRIDHGVQCEACHEAGSLHVEAAAPDLIRSPDRSICETCHVEKPSHE